jgi:hypothetical protein
VFPIADKMPSFITVTLLLGWSDLEDSLRLIYVS